MMLNDILSESAFWHFSIAFYDLESNKDSLLRLQDEADLNVNVVLLLLYMSLHDIVLTDNHLKKLLADISELDSLTSHVREARKQMKQLFIHKNVPSDFLRCATIENAEYKGLLEVELSLEKRQQAQLIRTLKGFDSLSSKTEQQDNVKHVFLKLTMSMVSGDALIKASVKQELKVLSAKLLVLKQKKPSEM